MQPSNGSRWGAARGRMAVALTVVMVGIGIPAGAVARVSTSRKASDASSSAAGLVDERSLETALHSLILWTTDQGGVASATGSFDTQAMVTTASGTVLTFLLSSFESAKSAKQAYQNFTNSVAGATPLSGTGDAAVSSAQDTYVLKGAQVLTVSAKPTTDAEAALDQIKASGGDPEPQFQAIAQAATVAAQSVAGRLSGKPSASTSKFVAPPGGVNPCQVPASTVGKLYKVKGVSAQPVLSEDPPATECSYSLPGIGAVLTFVTTGDQLYTPAAPNDVYAEYAAQVAAAQAQATTRAFERGDTSGVRLTAARTDVHRDLVPNRVYVPDVDIDVADCLEPRVVKVEYDGTIEMDDAQAQQAKDALARQLAQQQKQDQQLIDQANAKLAPARAAVQSAMADYQSTNGALKNFGFNASNFVPSDQQLQNALDARQNLRDALKKLKDLATDVCKQLGQAR